MTRIALDAVGSDGFALAGSGAIREHGLVDRLTHDVDLFTNNVDPAAFELAVDRLAVELRRTGHGVDEVRRHRQFAQLHVSTEDGRAVEIDLAVDWRELEPVKLSVGPVLSVTDAVASKVGALYTRLEARDFIDVDAIRLSGRFTDDQLLAAVAERDAGFERTMFADQLQQIRRVTDDRFTEYGHALEQIVALKQRFMDWASELRGESATSSSGLSPLV
ncbi:hypothetical protein BWO91_16585 [Plantibacter flavus]|nr:hypothetical protein BWO91_16585 [Plantibacter flavus]